MKKLYELEAHGPLVTCHIVVAGYSCVGDVGFYMYRRGEKRQLLFNWYFSQCARDLDYTLNCFSIDMDKGDRLALIGYKGKLAKFRKLEMTARFACAVPEPHPGYTIRDYNEGERMVECPAS